MRGISSATEVVSLLKLGKNEVFPLEFRKFILLDRSGQAVKIISSIDDGRAGMSRQGQNVGRNDKPHNQPLSRQGQYMR